MSRTAVAVARHVEARCFGMRAERLGDVVAARTIVSVMRAPVCSSLDTTSPPRRLRSSTSDSPVDFSVLLTSSPRVAMVSASRLEVSTMASVICCERSSIICTIAEDFCAKPWVTSSSRVSIICRQIVGELRELLGDVVGLEVQARGQPVAGGGDGVGGLAGWCARAAPAGRRRARRARRSWSRRRGRARA